MPKSRKHAKRRAKLRRRHESGQTWQEKLERKRQNDSAKMAQAKEPREKYNIDDIAGRA